MSCLSRSPELLCDYYNNVIILIFRIVIAARTADKLAETKQECARYTSDVHTIIADVSKEDDCREIVNKAVDEFGGIDILILNAAYSPTPQFFTDSKEPVSTHCTIDNIIYSTVIL